MTRLILYTKQSFLVEGVSATLAAAGGFQLCGSCSSVSELTDLLAMVKPDMALIEASPSITIESIKGCWAACPSTSIVLWTDEASTPFLYNAFNLGVRGILDRGLPVATQLECLRKVAAGDLWIEAEMCKRFLGAKRSQLTPRERDLIALITLGLRNKEIAFRMGITVATVKVYLSRLFAKLGVGSRYELALMALNHVTASADNGADAPQPTGSEGKPSFPHVFVSAHSRPPERIQAAAGKAGATGEDPCQTSIMALNAALEKAQAVDWDGRATGEERLPRVPIFRSRKHSRASLVGF